MWTAGLALCLALGQAEITRGPPARPSGLSPAAPAQLPLPTKSPGGGGGARVCGPHDRGRPGQEAKAGRSQAPTEQKETESETEKREKQNAFEKKQTFKQKR